MIEFDAQLLNNTKITFLSATTCHAMRYRESFIESNKLRKLCHKEACVMSLDLFLINLSTTVKIVTELMHYKIKSNNCNQDEPLF